MKLLKFKNSEFSKNTIWLISERVIRLFLSFIVWGKLAKDLSLQDFGYFSQYQNIAMTMLPLITFGSNQYIKKKLIESANDSIFLTSAVFTRLMISTIVFIALLVTEIFIVSRDHQILGMLLYFSLILRSFDVIELYFDSNLASKKSAKAKSLANLTTSLFYGFAIWWRVDIVYLGVIFLFEYFLTSSFYVKTLISKKLFSQKGLFFNLGLIKGSLLYFCAEILTTLQNRLSFFITELTLGISAVSYLSVAFRIADLGLIIPSTISITFLSLIMKSKNENNEKEEKGVVLKNLRFLNFFWISILLGFIICGEKLVTLVFGVKYLDVVFPIQILLGANLFVYWGFILEAIEVKHNRIKRRIMRTLLGFVTNFILCLVLIPRYSIKGAAIAYLVSVAVNFHFAQYLFKETRENAIWQLRSLLPSWNWR